MMTKVEVTCKLAKFQPSWLKLSLKGIPLGGTFLVENFLSEQVMDFQAQVYEKKKVTTGKLFSTFLLLWNWVCGRRIAFMLVTLPNLWRKSVHLSRKYGCTSL